MTDVGHAQTGNGVLEPAPGDIIAGIVVVNGTAADANFLRYELAFRQESGLQSDWIVFAQGDQQVLEDTLAVWDTTVGGEISPVFPDGNYQLRLRVVRTDYNYDEYFVTDLTVSNFLPTPTITPTLAITVSTTPTRLPDVALEATRLAASGALPSLTPFPTISPQATPVEQLADVISEEQIEGSERVGLLDQLTNVETNRFGEAFINGAMLVAAAFLLLALYLLLRAIARRLWRSMRGRRYRSES